MFLQTFTFPPLNHSFEELDGLGILGQLNNCLLPVLAVSCRIASCALFFTQHIEGGNLLNLYAEDAFNSSLDLDLVSIGCYFENGLLKVCVFHRLLSDDGANNDIVHRLHYAYTSSIFARAALSTMNFLVFMIS